MHCGRVKLTNPTLRVIHLAMGKSETHQPYIESNTPSNGGRVKLANPTLRVIHLRMGERVKLANPTLRVIHLAMGKSETHQPYIESNTPCNGEESNSPTLH